MRPRSPTSRAARPRTTRVYLLAQPAQLMCAYGGAHPHARLRARRLVPERPASATASRRAAGQRGPGRPGACVSTRGRCRRSTARRRRCASSCCSACSAAAGLALLAGLMVARRAMAPIVELTASAREIERTRDPGRHVPAAGGRRRGRRAGAHARGHAAGARRGARGDGGDAARQREFVADASHELRTPLTSVLANLELLAEQARRRGRGDAAASALRSSQRMRRLVADLLLLARADAGRAAPHRPIDLAQVLVEVAAELEPRDGRPPPDDRRRTTARRRRRARRAAPAGAEPDRERAAPHARPARTCTQRSRDGRRASC